MRPASAALQAYLAANDSFAVADLYTFKLQSGEVLRFSGWTTPLTIPGTVFPADSLNHNPTDYANFALGPRFGRSRITTKIGIEPTELDVAIYAGADDTIGAFSFAEAVRVGQFDGATVELDRLVAASAANGPGTPPAALGAIVWFYGRVAEADAGRSSVTIKVKSLLNLLAVQQMPRRLYQAACTHVFGDAMCTFNRETLAVTTAALTGSTQGAIVTALAPSPATLFDQGTIVGVTGANAGLTRTVSIVAGGAVNLLKAWLYPVMPGDTFKLLPGCDHTVATCQGTFNNLSHYGGFPYIPPPELAV